MASIIDFVATHPRLTHFAQVLSAAIEWMDADTLYTIFAPHDPAITQFPHAQQHTTWIKAHVVVGAWIAADLMDIDHLTNLNGDVLVVDQRHGLQINHAYLIEADQCSDYGVVHIIDAVLSREGAAEPGDQNSGSVRLYSPPTLRLASVGLAGSIVGRVCLACESSARPRELLPRSSGNSSKCCSRCWRSSARSARVPGSISSASSSRKPRYAHRHEYGRYRRRARPPAPDGRVRRSAAEAYGCGRVRSVAAPRSVRAGGCELR